nr:monodehydroascorbate reductase [Tanacetum cinerariifolium]
MFFRSIRHEVPRAFTAFSSIPSIYIQQFWDTVHYDKSAWCYRCQLDEQWFNLTKDTLKDALQITPAINNQAFTSPSSSDALINFVNELGYPKLVRNLSNVITNDMFQPWRALTTIINLCLMGKTSGFERPRAPVLQILWGVVIRAHLDYAERIWEEFTQSIHTFIEDKRNLAHHTHGKKKATLIVIPGIRFTKLIIYHLQRKYKFHPRPDSPLHLPNEEPVLGYLKFSAKGTKREVFGIPVPGSLITSDIQGATYYQEYLAKVAKHQRHLASETGSDPDSPAPKPTKTAKKSKPIAPKADPRPPVSKPASYKQPEPKTTPAKTQGKKRKLATEISDKPSKAKKSRPGLVSKRRKHISSLRSVDESVAKDVPNKEPRVDDEEADMQRALEESLKSMYDVPRGPLPPVVIRKPKSGKYQPLPEVPGKGKEKVFEEQVACDLLTLQMPKKKSPADRYIFQRRTSAPTGSSGHDESSSLYAELVLTDSEEESEEDVPGADAGVQGEAQAGPDPGAQNEGQAGSNPDEQAEGQARPDPGNAEASQPLPSPVVHAGLDLKHMDLDVVDVSTQLLPEQMDKGFTVTAYPKVQENLKLTIEEHVILEEPASSSGTLSSLQHLTKTSALVIYSSVTNLRKSITTKQLQKPKLNQWCLDLPKADMKEILHQRMSETDSYKTHKDHMQLYEALEKSMNHDHCEELAKDLAEVRKKKKKSRELPKTPPRSPPHQPSPPPPPAGQSKGSAAPSSSKIAASVEYQAWTTTDIRLMPSISLTPADLQIDDDMAPDEQAQSSDDEDIRNAHIPKASALASTYSPPPEDSLLAWTGDIAMFMDLFCKRRGITELKPQDLEGLAFEIIKVFHPNVIHLQYQMEECHKLLTDNVDDSILRHNVSKPLPLGGPPGQVTIQSDFFFNKHLEYLRYGSKGSRPALSILKMKAAYYPDVGLEPMVPDQMWIEEECKHTSEGDRRAVRTHMRILSVVRIEVFSMYGYDYMKKIVLCCTDLNEHVIAKQDFKYLYPSDFEDLYLLNLQGHLNHLPPKDKKILTTAVNLHLVIRQRVEDFQLGIESYQTQLNLTKPRWDATGFKYKHDYIVIDSPRAVTFQDSYGVQMIMRFNEIHKFSDGTLQQIDEALDYRAKEFKINRMNPGLNTRFWTRKDVDRSKEFMFAI